MFHALGEILLSAVPTILLLVLLHFYLKHMFFKPMETVLRQRHEATEGSRKLAQEALERADARATEYENALRAARSEVYQAHEESSRQLQERETVHLAAARQAAEQAVREAREALEQDVEQAKAALRSESDSLADAITESILREKAA
jgi:F-type H+-transporting ATPase subunit b